MRNPRISVVVKPSVLSTLERMGDATGQSVSGIVGDFMEMVEPILARVVMLKELSLKADREARSGLVESLERAQDELEPVVMKALEILGVAQQEATVKGASTAPPRAELRAVAGGGEGVNPRIVTRGSGQGGGGKRAERRGVER